MSMRKHPRNVIRAVRKDGSIRWDHRDWRPKDDTHIDRLIGERLCFGTYAPRYDILCLWGTVDELMAETAEEARRAASEARKILMYDAGHFIAYWWVCNRTDEALNMKWLFTAIIEALPGIALAVILCGVVWPIWRLT